jgi:hypothetical protein
MFDNSSSPKLSPEKVYTKYLDIESFLSFFVGLRTVFAEIQTASRIGIEYHGGTRTSNIFI